MDNRFLDKEEKFYNYHTADIEGTDIFDIHKASNNDAQQILNGDKYWREDKNTYSEIVQMTPMEYFKACAEDCFDEPVEKLIQSRRRDKDIIEHLKQVIQIYKKKFPICYIDYATHYTPSQEGLHRMMVAGDLFGWDTKFPVQIIKWVDQDRATKDKEWKHMREIERYLERAIDRALRYKYYNIEELKDQLKSEFESEVRYVDEFENKDFTLTLEDDGDFYLVTIDGKYKNELPKDKILFLDETDREDDLEDIDLEDLSDWMKDLLVDLDRDKLKLTEKYGRPQDCLMSKELLNNLQEKFGKDYDTKPLCKEVCEYVHDVCPESELLKFMIGVWKYDGNTMEPISMKGHCVIRFDNRVYDYTSNQYADYGIDEAFTQPRVLEYDEKSSDKFDSEIYTNGNYAISVY